AAEGIRLLRTPDPDADTGFDVALVEAGGERTFVTALGAESLLAPGAWDLVRVRPGDAVYVSGYGLVPPGPGQVLGAWAAGLPAQRGRRADRHPCRSGHLAHPGRTRPVPGLLGFG